MGRQINFFMTNSDEDKFIKYVKSTGDVLLFGYISKTSDFQPLERLPETVTEKFSLGIWLFNRSISKNLETKYIYEQGYFLIDQFNSSVIEFSRCYQEGNAIFRGRIHADFTYMQDNKWINKEPEFGKWYKQIASWLRRNYQRMDSVTYIGPDAGRLFNNGELELIETRTKKRDILWKGNLQNHKIVYRERNQ